LAQVDPLKGKFRSFLLASIQNYLSKEVDRALCLKRGGETEFVPLDEKNAEDRYRLEPTDYLTAETGVEGQSLTPEDRLFLLMQAGLYLTLTQGLGASEARVCYERTEALCHSLNRPELLYSDS
jgi:hypothetical protein